MIAWDTELATVDSWANNRNIQLKEKKMPTDNMKIHKSLNLLNDAMKKKVIKYIINKHM